MKTITHAFLKVTLLNVCVSEETILDVAAKKTVMKCLDNEFYKDWFGARIPGLENDP
jgi:hypothetical protein